ncbi:hypothetical protein EON79_02665 [bacterium]|nr:MAG: hypothetical protein EON79_02665 [bacterium]
MFPGGDPGRSLYNGSVFLMFTPLPSHPQIAVLGEPGRQTATIQDLSGNVKLRLAFSEGCIVDRLEISGRQVLDPAKGIWSGIKVGGGWHTTASLEHPPKVTRSGNRLTVAGIRYGGGGFRIVEGWTLIAGKDSIEWKIDRRYLDGGTLEDTAMPLASFADMTTWTGALLGTGGVAWGKLLDAPNATYGIHTASASLWNPASDALLRFAAKGDSGSEKALRFTRGPEGNLLMASAITGGALRPKHGKSRFQRERQDIWAPFNVMAGQTVSATFELKASSYRQTYGRGDFKGLDTAAITELLNTIGRIGVIDEGLVGSNGWYSGYICMHEPWLARVGTALNDPNYTRSCAGLLDDAREHAILPDGMVKSRWKYDAGDAQPGTYDEATGYYEAQWGRLMDSQTSYVTNVADQFDQSGDKAWVARQKQACESALGYLLRRDADGDGLVEMANRAMGQRRSSDWLDIVWASHENAFVNAQLYGALQKWATVERILGDGAKAAEYLAFAAKLKASFNKPVAEGGFWNPAKGWYVYWRDADDSVHGDNLTVHANLTALGEGICDDPGRRETLLSGMEARMDRESLLAWPSCFESFAPGEGADDVFPTYENGDVFLAWAEYGVRAYAATHPEIALKYVRRITDQYKKDGLAYQRYLRTNGKGAGDDILANNCNVVTGLYRDIFGIQPRYNRLYLEPHLVPELNGTRVDYDLRSQPLAIDLSMDDYRVTHGPISVRSSQPFGVDFGPNGFTYFARNEDRPALSVQGGALGVHIEEWGARKRWTLAAGSKPSAALHTFPHLATGIRYRVLAEGKPFGMVSSTKPAVRVSRQAGCPTRLELVAIP